MISQLASKFLLLAAIPLALVACGGGGTNVQTSSANLSYHFNENGCDTGSHSFGSLSDMCNGLENDSLNNGCAADLRQGMFQQSCSGAFADNLGNGNSSPTVNAPAQLPADPSTPSFAFSQAPDGLTYNFQENGCKTGAHTFATLDDFCNALQDESLNNGCADDLRANLFKNECSPLSIH